MISDVYQSFDLPSIHSLSLARHDPYAVPRLYHRSSEGSEADSPTGGGGSQNPHPSQPTQSNQGQSERRLQPQEPTFVDFDSPYVPHRQFVQSPREQTSADYFSTPDPPLYAQRSAYNSAGPSARYQYNQTSPVDLHNRAFDPRGFSRSGPHGEASRTGLEHQWRHGQGQIRTHPPIYPGDDITYYESRPASSSHSGHGPTGLPLPPHTGVFDAQPEVLGYHHGASESRFPDAGDYLRGQLNIAPGEEVSLWSLPTPPGSQKPPQPLPVLIKLAIYGCPRKKLTLQEIYTALEGRFQWFRDHRGETAWKNSIRHNLSLNKVFRNTARPITEPGKGSYWELDISGGEGYKRERKRKKKTTSSSQSNADDEDGSDDNDEGSTSPPASQASLDPQGSSDGNHGGVSRLRSNSRRTSPYQPSSPPMPSNPPAVEAAGSYHSTSGSPPIHSLPAPFGPSQPRFGQPSFGQPTFGQPSFSQPVLGQSSFGQRTAFTSSGFPSQTTSSSQASQPAFDQSSMLPEIFPPTASTSSSPGLYWPASDHYTTYMSGTSLPQDSSSNIQRGPNQPRLDRSKSTVFIPQHPGSGRGRGV